MQSDAVYQTLGDKQLNQQHKENHQTEHESLQNKNLFGKSKLRGLLLRFVGMLFLALVVELGVFNYYFWSFDSELFPRRELNLPYQQQLQRNGTVVLSSQPSLTLSNINMPVWAIEVESYGGDYRVTGKIYATSEANAYIPQKISPFYTASGLNQNPQTPAQDYQKFLVKFDLSEKVNSIIIAADASTINSPWLITKIVINPEPELNLSLVRLLLMVIGFTLLYILLFSKLYRINIAVGSKTYKRLNHGIFGIMLLFSCGIFAAYHPALVTDMGFRPVALGFFPYNTPEHTVLWKIPTTQQELGNTDPYVQLTDALFVKHQLNLDLWVDPALQQLDNIYDRTERDSKKVQYYWDHAFYNGKYYCYYGLAPVILIYGPIYLWTGMIPSSDLAIFIAALWALLGLHVLSSRLLSLLCTKCNMLLFAMSKCTLFMSSLVFFVQAQFLFYCLPYLLAMSFVCLGLSFGLGLWFKPNRYIVHTLKHSIDTKVSSISNTTELNNDEHQISSNDRL